MAELREYDALVVVTPQDFQRTEPGRKRLISNLPMRKIYFVGNPELGELVEAEALGDRVGYIDENSILPFDIVYDIISDIMRVYLAGRKLPRGIAGWYYQQFLKMEYARNCADKYYFVWDGDTVPTASFSMFMGESDTPYLDVKQEYHKEYFDTIENILPGLKKVIRPSFISEHMLICSDIMREMLDEIEGNVSNGMPYYEVILRSISADKMQDSCFSEFETFGTYVAVKHPSLYRLREWHSFRLGAEFFHPETMEDRDYIWLSKDFQAISFEKNQYVREDHENLFNNPRYQEKLSARQMLEIAQEEFTEGYKEEWNTITDDADNNNGAIDISN